MKRPISLFKASVLSAAVVTATTAQAQILEEVIVTAQKQAQSSQDIGLAIAALSGEALREQGINRGDDLARVIPNVSIQNISGGGLPVVIVRGIGLQNFRINDSPTTSFYVDEVYQTSIASVEFSMFDLERVEVLKGPQGGLYGRNTIGGAVQVISERPTIGGDATGFASLSYGRWSQTDFEGAAEFPLGDNAGLRVSGRIEQSDDKVFRSTTSNTDYGEEDRWAARGLLRWAPSDTSDVLLKIHGGSDASELPLLRAQGLYQNIGNAAAFGLPNVSLGLASGLLGGGITGYCSSVQEGRGSDPTTCATLTGVTPADYGQTDGNVFSSASGDLNPALDSSWGGVSLQAEFELSGGYTLTSISAYDEIDYRRFNEVDSTPVEFQNIDYGTDIEFWSQEFRLAYDDGGDFTWIAGVYYGEDDLDESTILSGGGGLLPFAFGGATFSPQEYMQQSEAWAVYAHSEWQFSESWELIAELRYTDEEKSFKGGQLLGFSDGSTAPFLAVDDTYSFDDTSGKIGLNWTPADNMLIYASIADGFKVGGFFGGFATSQGQLQSFEAESILAYEGGIKSEWMDGTLRANVALFVYDREDVQMNASEVTDEIVSIARLQNVGDVDSRGGELDITWLPSENLTLQMNLGYTDSEIDDSDFRVNSPLSLLGGASLEGANIPNYSKFSANLSGRYEQEIGSTLMGWAQLEYAYRSERDLSLITQPFYEDPIFKEPSYDLWNLRLGIRAPGDNWQVMAFIENLADEEYRALSRGDGLYGAYELYGQPRSWGVKFTYDW